MTEDIYWARRLAGSKLRRLYQSDVAGLLDEVLLDDVGTTLYQRCRSILDVRSAKQGHVRCQGCDRLNRESWIERGQIRKKDWDQAVLECPICGWRVNWGDFVRSFKRQQLNSGGALPEFEMFVALYPTLREPGAKLFAIDRLIHAFHYSFKERPNMPSRPVGPNLIKGKLEEVIVLLDELTYGISVREAWEGRLQRYRKEYLGEYLRRP
jgi:hypothetical protein